MPTRQTAEATAQGAEAGPDLGARLRHAREAQGLTIDELATELRISAGALAALEDDRFEALGAPVFAKGYLKQYGSRLGLDVRALASDFERAAGAADFEMAPLRKIRLRDERQISLWILAGLALVLVIGFLAYRWIDRGGSWSDLVRFGEQGEQGEQVEQAEQGERTSAPAPAAVPPATEAAPPPARPASSPVLSAPPAVIDQADAAAADTTAADTAPAEASDLAGAPAAADTGAAAIAASPPSAAAPGAPPAGAAGAAAAAAPGAAADFAGPALEVHFVEDSWAEISDGDGNRLFYNLGRAGTRLRFPADPDLNLLFGNARAIELAIDGAPLTIPGARRAGQVVAFDLATLID